MSNALPFPTALLADVVDVLDNLRVPINGAERMGRAGTIPYYGANGFQGWIDRPLFNEPLILLAEDGGNFDDFATRPIAYRIDGPAWVNNHAHIIRAKNGVCQSFIFWSIVNKDIRKYIAGGTRTKLTQGELRRIEINLPIEHEQKEIANVLDTLDTAIHETEAIIAKLKAVKQGLLHDLLTRGIDANGELRPPQAEAPHLYKESPLGLIPKGWAIRNLGECAAISSGVTLGRNITGSGLMELPYLRVANVQDGFVDLSDVKTVQILRSELERFSLADGDVLMNEGGDFDKLGRGTVWRSQINPCLHQNHVFRVRCIRNILAPDYLAAYSASQRGKLFFIQSSKQSTNLASINSTQLKSFPIVCPELFEQNKVVERLETFSARISGEEANLNKLQYLKASLMDDLLTGRVRVTPLLAEAAQ